MKEIVHVVRLRDFMETSEGWGREQGRAIFPRLVDAVESHPEAMVIRLSLDGIRRTDISFASETGVELARKYRGAKGVCLLDPGDDDMVENWEAATERKRLPLCIWKNRSVRIIGLRPSPGLVDALGFALARPVTKVSDFVRANGGISVANASNKFKQLWEQGFLLRREDAASTGGKEFTYIRIG